MDTLRRHQEAVLMDQNQNPLNMAKLALVSGDLEEIAARWERACALVPDAVLRSPDSLDILFALKRFDEAELLMRRRLKRYPGDSHALMGLARIAEARGDVPEALRRWTVVRRKVQDTVEGYIGCARCLVGLGLLDDAEAELNRALRYESGSHGVLVPLARLSDQRKDWPRSIERWKRLVDEFNDGPAFAGAAKAMVELGRFDEAEAYLAEPARIYPSNLEIALTRTHVAERRGDMSAAGDRWERVRSIDPFFHAGYHEGARCLSEAGRHADADQVMVAAIERFPDQTWPFRDFALLAHRRHDWDEAAARWSVVRERFPKEAEGYALGADALTAAGRSDEASALRRDP
jgi:tetratricopeptide (TPR) repeat protein